MGEILGRKAEKSLSAEQMETREKHESWLSKHKPALEAAAGTTLAIGALMAALNSLAKWGGDPGIIQRTYDATKYLMPLMPPLGFAVQKMGGFKMIEPPEYHREK